MSNLIHIISWERFCQKDNLNDLEKYAQFLTQRYPGLLDIRNLNIKLIGPPLEELPEKCLTVLVDKSSLLLNHRNASDSISGVDVIFKLICLIARNNKNLDSINEKGTVGVVMKYIDLSMQELSTDLDTEWMNLFEYLLYFMEIIYDPTFSWRRLKRLYFSETAVREEYNDSVTALAMTNATVTWLCSQLNAFSDHRDLCNRLLNLFCSIVSGSTTNAQLLITPAVVDTFKFQSDVNAEAIASYCFLISSLSKINMVKRQEDLSVVIKKLLTFIRAKSELRIHEIRCLDQLCDVSAELCEELIVCDVFSVLERCLTEEEEAGDVELYRLVFVILTRLTLGPYAAQQQFVVAKGYDRIFEIIIRSRAQPTTLLELLFTWAVAEAFDSSKMASYQYVIRDGHVAGVLVRWAVWLAIGLNDGSHCGPVPVPWKTVFTVLTVMCHKDRRSTSKCCSAGVAPVICACIKSMCATMAQRAPHNQVLCSELLNDLFHLLEMLTQYSVSGVDLVAIVTLMKDPHTKIRARRVIKLLNNIVSEVLHNDDVNCWFELSESDDGIMIAPANEQSSLQANQNINNLPIDKDVISLKPLEAMAGKINQYSFSFHCWIKLSPLSVSEKVDAGQRRSCIMRLLTDLGNGFEIFLNMDGQLFVATCHQGEFHYVHVTAKNPTKKSQFSIEENILTPNKWHMIDFVFQNARNFFSKSMVTVYIDGQFVNILELKYPQINEKISVFHIGGCPMMVSKEMLATLNSKLRRKSGFLGATSQKRVWLGEEHVLWGALSSPKCCIATVACLNDALTVQAIVSLYLKGPMNCLAIAADEPLANNIIVNYHALVYDPVQRSCSNLHPLIQSSKLSLYNCGHLRGERLSWLKLEVAINEIGGVSAMLPIIELLDSMHLDQDKDYRPDVVSSDAVTRSPVEDTSSAMIPGQKSEGNPSDSILANIVILLRKISLLAINQRQMERTKFIEIIGSFLQKIDVVFLDMNVIIAFHAMAEQCKENIQSSTTHSSSLHTSIYRSILLDWRIWGRCCPDTRSKHCTFICNLVKHDRPLFRSQYGIGFFLDVIRLYHFPSDVNGIDETKRLRKVIYDIVYGLVHKHAGIQDYQRIVKVLHECNCDILIQELLELSLRLFFNSNKMDQDSLLIYENKLMESLFVILIRDFSIVTKEMAINFLHALITSDRVKDRCKGHLLLHDISFASIFTYKEFYESPISLHSIQQLLEILRKAASKDLFGVVQFFSLLTLSSVEQRIDAIRMLKSFFDKSPDAIFAISQQPGWQDILIHLFVFKKREDCDTSINNNNNNNNNESAVKSEDIKVRNTNYNGVGLRRSSTWTFDDSVNLNNGFQKSNFDEILEEDEDYSTSSDNQATPADDSQDIKSIDTVYLHRKSIENNNNSILSSEDDKFNFSMLKERSIGSSFSGSEEASTLPKSVDISLDDSGVRENIDLTNGEDELVQLILDCLDTVISSVLTSANSNHNLTWMTVHQVMESLRSVNERYSMLKSVCYIRQRVLIGLLNSITNLIRSSEIISQNNLNHAKELIHLIVDSSCIICAEINYKYEMELFDKTAWLLQDYLKVWDEDSPYADMAALGFYYFLTLSCSQDSEVVSTVCARLHQIITSLSKITVYEEIAFIVVHLDGVLTKVVDTENYYFVAPILKTLLEHHSDMLQVSMYLPNISIKTPDFYDYFKVYCTKQEWRTFVKSRLCSACEIYESSYLNSMTTEQSLWRAQANERTSMDREERRAINIVHKKQFETAIINLTLSWIKEERRKKDYKIRESQKQNDSIQKYWNGLKQFLISGKGCWKDEENPIVVRLKQSCRENYLRMRPRFEINYQFDSHLNASLERDHPCRSPVEQEQDALNRLSGLEKRFDFADLSDDQLGDDEWRSLQNIESADINTNATGATAGAQSTASKKSLLECHCKLISLTEVVEGKFELTNTHLIFHRNMSDSSKTKITCSINQIREVHLRRYNLQRSAIEIFLTDQTNYFFNFDTKKRDQVYSKIVALRPPNLIYSKARSPADLLNSSNLTQRWVHREISNFEYLMQLNTIAGRTYNDMSQYPVFPWIIADYTSPKLDLTNPKTFRDLSKPIGVVNPKHEDEVREKYDSYEDPMGIVSKFHYGTHYSVSAGVMHYLVRMEPFTKSHILLQSGKFDAADRQFHSIPLSWTIIMDSPNDNKELIPEFFYQPQFLRNKNNFDFGLMQQTKMPIDDVELPAWASSPEDFIYQHRQALECEHVSLNLHHWIDLIFGYKQKGIEAVNALNVFYYVTYEGVIDFDKISDPHERESLESMINNFGQTPCQLLKSAHPCRLSAEELRSKMIRVDKFLPVMPYMGHLKHSSKVISSSSEPITFVRVPAAQARNLIGPYRSFTMVTIHSSNVIARHNWTPNAKGHGSLYSVDVDSVFDQLNTRKRSHLGPLNSTVGSSNQLYVVTPDCKYVLAGGNVESRLTVMALKKLEPTYPPTPHHGSISCLALDIDSGSTIVPQSSLAPQASSSPVGIQLYGISGSLDSTCAVWDWSELPAVKVIQVLCGHSGPVTSVSLSTYLDVAVSGSSDGSVNVHTVTKGELLTWLVPGGLTSSVDLAVNVVLLSPLGHLYVQWQRGLDHSSQPSHRPKQQQQFVSLYSIHGDRLSTCDLGFSRVTVATAVPKCPGSMDSCIIIGTAGGQLTILDGYDLTELNTFKFTDSILDATVLSQNGQYLATALSNGRLVISAVCLDSIDN